MASRVIVPEATVFNGRLKGKWKKGAVLENDRYWQKWPDLFEQCESTSPKKRGLRNSGDSPQGGGDTE